MKFLINLCVININGQSNEDHGQYVEETRPEGHQVVFHSMVGLAPALTGLWPLNVLLLLAGLELYGDNVGLGMFCSVAH